MQRGKYEYNYIKCKKYRSLFFNFNLVNLEHLLMLRFKLHHVILKDLSFNENSLKVIIPTVLIHFMVQI